MNLTNVDKHLLLSLCRCYNVYQGLLININCQFMEKKFITIKEAAKILGVSTLTLRNWDNNGRFPAARHPISNYRVYMIKDLEDLLISIQLSKGHKRPSRNEVKKLMVKHLKPEDGEISE